MMQLPKRRSQTQKLRSDQDAERLITTEGMQRLRDELTRLKKERPILVEDVARLVQLGDLSENAEYQEAKQQLRRINDRIVRIEDRLLHAVPIKTNHHVVDRVALGTKVVLRKDSGEHVSYSLVGPHESSPSHGRISHLSPLGAALIGHTVGEIVTFSTPSGKNTYTIVSVSSF